MEYTGRLRRRTAGVSPAAAAAVHTCNVVKRRAMAPRTFMKYVMKASSPVWPWRRFWAI